MEVIKVSEASKQLEKMLLERKERFQQILNQNADRFITLAINYAVKNPVIFQCDPKSILSAVLDAARLNLEIGFGLVELLPMNIKGKMTAVFYIGYQGYLEMIYRTGFIKIAYANAVFEKDKFEISYGTNGRLVHKPYLKDDKGELLGVYAYAETLNKGKFYVFLTKKDIEYFRNRGKSPNSFAWENDYIAMAKKTAIRQLIKFLPKHQISHQILNAIQVDEAVEWGKVKYDSEEEKIMPDYDNETNLNNVIERSKELLNVEKQTKDNKTKGRKKAKEYESLETQGDRDKTSEKLINELFNRNYKKGG